MEKDEPWPGSELILTGLAELAFAMQVGGERGTAVERQWAVHQLPDAGCKPDELLYLAASATLLDANDDTVRFVHQLIQEYFAALAWKKRLATDDLKQYWSEGWSEAGDWDETTVLLAGMLDEMTPLVEKLLPVNPALAARCIGASGGACKEATEATVRQALEEIAFGTTAPVLERNAAANALNFIGDTRPGVGLDESGLPDIVWCDVPAGEFLMGNDKETDEMALDSEKPQHTVYLDAYRIAKYPVTNAQYQAFVEAGGYEQRSYWTDEGWAWRTREKSPGRNATAVSSTCPTIPWWASPGTRPSPSVAG